MYDVLHFIKQIYHRKSQCNPLYKLHMSNFSSVHDSFGELNSSLKLERSVLIGRYKLNVYKNLLRKYLIFDQTHSRTAVDVK